MNCRRPNSTITLFQFLWTCTPLTIPSNSDFML